MRNILVYEKWDFGEIFALTLSAALGISLVCSPFLNIQRQDMASLKTRAVKFFGLKLTCTNRRKVSSSLCLGIFKAVTISKCPQCYQEGKGSEEKKGICILWITWDSVWLTFLRSAVLEARLMLRTFLGSRPVEKILMTTWSGRWTIKISLEQGGCWSVSRKSGSRPGSRSLSGCTSLCKSQTHLQKSLSAIICHSPSMTHRCPGMPKNAVLFL